MHLRMQVHQKSHFMEEFIGKRALGSQAGNLLALKYQKPLQTYLNFRLTCNQLNINPFTTHARSSKRRSNLPSTSFSGDLPAVRLRYKQGPGEFYTLGNFGPIPASIRNLSLPVYILVTGRTVCRSQSLQFKQHER
jgi:hypothetical protein